jgi:septal ring factor EnvC (AmiA/AmiB activator)
MTNLSIIATQSHMEYNSQSERSYDSQPQMEYSESQADSQSQSNLVQGALLSMSTELDKQGIAISGVNTTISGLKTTVLELKAENVILKTDNVILKGKITTIEEQMEVIISEKIANRNRMLVRQIIFSYEMHLSRAYGVCKNGTKLKHLSSMTHKTIFFKISNDEKIFF